MTRAFSIFSDRLGLGKRTLRASICIGALGTLGACEAFQDLALFDPFTGKAEVEAESTGSPLQLVQRDVETPSAFSVTDKAVWDGRPSLGGIWVAYPGNVQPERVNIRNMENNETVVGALFKRERQSPGPAIQVSSDAANALGMVPGKSVEISVIALRREAVDTAPPAIAIAEEPVPEPDVEVVTIDAESAKTPKQGSEDAAQSIAAAVASIQSDSTPAAPSPAPALKNDDADTDGGKRAYVQVGVFAKESNANALARKLTDSGILSTARALDAGTKTLYRVVAGPASSPAELKSNLAKIKAQGFDDAYTVIR